MDAEIRLGSIGTGQWGEHLADAVMRTGCATIHRCFSRTVDARERFAARFGCRPADSLNELLDDRDLDGVLIATPHSTHVALAVAAAEAGKHLFVEKPLSLTVPGGKRIIAAAERAGVVLQVANHRSRQAGIDQMQRWIKAGELGVVQLLEANFSTNVSVTPKAGWKHDAVERPLGGMTTLGLHILEAFVTFAGMPSKVTTMSKRVVGRTEIDDITTMTLDFTSGPCGYLATGLAIPKMEVLGVHGSAGSAWNHVVVAPGGAALQADRLYRQNIDDLERRTAPNQPNDALGQQMRDFANSVITGRPPENGGVEALRMVTLIAAGLESRRTGLAVDLDGFDPTTIHTPHTDKAEL